ncbi:MAG: translation initiation factor IF-2 [Bacteroidaceae bacterium]|nr:translation initiation factor IF-2 [Bacteroidaceae bacterium]MDO4994124.1 translation initiation factor IF-2 [Bacteroidales bacterium]
MPVRLNKALKELNVGINTVAEFLQKKGKVLEDVSPNAKITDEQYELLMSAFGADKSKHEEIRLDIQKRKEKEQKERDERREQQQKERAEKKKQSEEPFRTPSERKQTLKIVGNINDIQAKKAPAKPKEDVKEEPVVPTTPAETKPAIEQTTEPQAEVTVEAPVEETKTEKKPSSKKKQEVLGTTGDDGVFRMETPDAGVQFKQVGFIDLSSINSKTRPDKKSKAERKKEREEKERQRKQTSAAPTAAGQTGEPGKKKKRARINSQRVDINAVANQQQQDGNKKKKGQGGQNSGAGQNQQSGGKKKKKNSPAKQPELTDEEISRQVKETLARLTSKQMKKGVKYRKDKRDAIHQRMEEEEAAENAESKVLKLTEYVTANELATMMDVPVTKVIGTCMSIGVMVSINQRLDAETINLVAEEFGFTTTYVSEDVSNAIVEEEDKDEDLVPRAPIITVMGHVDHGKTSLLDYIRKTNVIAGEAGGITQHIGAYNVKMASGKHITFLDTPGHEAFTAMRARGAKVTDIAIIIIAADDSIMPQTREAISHAEAAGVPMVFAINKIDKPGANPEKIKEALAGMNYLVEDWGGKYQSQDISAKKGINVDELMEKVLLEAEILDLKANPNRKATGSVIESSLDKGRGYVATVLVQNGTLRQGDVVLAGTHYGRVKAMFNERGQRIQQALPAEPALILGLNGAPTAGDQFHVMESEQEARELAAKREQLKREQGIRTTKRKGLEDIAHDIAVGGVQDLNLVVKGDVDGSIEALSDSLIKLSTEKIKVNVIYKAVGQISESDVDLAKASDAIIIGFQVRPSQAARKLAEQEGVDIRLYSIIYDTIEEIKSAMEGMLAPEIKEEYTGTAEVRQVYKITKVGTVAGAFVTDGKIHRSDKIRVIRDGIVVHTSDINALKRFKDDVKEVSNNFDCGISLVNYNDIREGDVLEAFTEVEVKQKL